MLLRSLAIFTSALWASGCVSKGTYDAAVESANVAAAKDRSRASALEAQIATLTERDADLQRQLEGATSGAQGDLARLRREEASIAARAALVNSRERGK